MRKLAAVAMMLGLLLALAGAGEVGAKSRTVRCDEGADLQRAIERAASGDTIAITGVCRGEFAIRGKKLTLNGRGAALESLVVAGAKGNAILRDLAVVGESCTCEEVAVVPTRDVVVATQAIQAGDTIEPMLVLSMLNVPVDATNEIALTDPTLALGAIAAIDILPNQLITPNLLQEGPVRTDPIEPNESPTATPDG